ncbi:S-adenosyl-L-methionine-dependent methyltransferase [Parathielavia appendiculata]|uniref:S-adenosyl-L-methionine-dependent methyltransferase n=1 Tax=Parathielavia appendiculata TaxID=2587402 RepID=A0AAN6TXV7_9PEZI|nr:S-adenosyl-L-methionine-dependent methyltransferase [Parathielavia appendiculata]
MDSMLQKLNSALQEAVDAFNGPLHTDLLGTFKDPDSLPQRDMGARTAVSSNIPDLLAAIGPQSIAELASRSGSAKSMRVLHSNGIFGYDATSGFGTDENIFAYFAARGLQDKFHATLGAGAVAQAPGTLADYPWAELGDAVVLDMGGGGGDFIVSFLRAHRILRWALLELESVVAMVQPRFQDADGVFADVGNRMVALHVGDFHDAVPAYEVYTMKWCLHNWRDEEVVRILLAVRSAIIETPRVRMVIIEAVLSEGRSSRVWRYGDLTMMATVNGQERTEEEWRSLPARPRWEVKSVSPLRNAWASAIDLRRIRLELNRSALS